MDDKKKRGIQEMSGDTRLLYQHLVASEVGQVLSYAELGAVINRNVQGDARHILQSARNKALCDDGVVFDVVVNVGLKRLSDVEIATSTGEHHIGRMRRTARRCVRQLACVASELPAEVATRYNASMMVANLVGLACSRKKVRALEGLVQERGNKELPIAATIEALKK